MRSLITLTALIAAFSFPVLAETQPAAQSPMRYTRIHNTPATENTTHIKTKTIQNEEEAPAEEETPSTRIWNKYKALAAGEPEKQDGEETAEMPQEETPVKQESEADLKAAIAKEELEQQQAQPSGVAGIIDEYRRNKAKRSEMRTITVTKPADVQPAAGEKSEKPES